MPAELTNVIAIAAGSYHNLAVKADGTVRGWGDSGFGQATPPAGLSGVVDVAAGANHSMALKNNGTVVVWGDGAAGQTNVPAGLSAVVAIAAGEHHCLALTSGGAVVAWGANGYFQSSVPAFTYYPIRAIAAGAYHSLALGSYGYVQGFGGNAYGQAPPLVGPGYTNIAAGADFSLGISSGGQVFGWGNNFLGQCSPPAGLANVIAIAAGYGHGLALKSDHSVVAWGDNTGGQATVPAGLGFVAGISAGRLHSLVVKVDPAVITAHPQSRTVAAGSSVTFSVSTKGSPPMFYQWLRGETAIYGATEPTYTIDHAQFSDSTYYSVLVGNSLNFLRSSNAVLTVNSPPSITAEPQGQEVVEGVRVEFSVQAAGSTPFYYQWRCEGTNLPGATASTYIINSARMNHAGNYRVVVANAFGAVTSQVANLLVHNLPVIASHPESQAVMAGSSVSFLVDAPGATSYQWHKDGSQIADATGPSFTINSVKTTDAGTYFVAVSNAYGGLLSSNATLTVSTPPAGSNVLLVLWGEREVWNGSDYVDLTPPAGLTELLGLASGVAHVLALKSDRTVVGWGDNTHGQAGPPPMLNNVSETAAGAWHSLARKLDGTLAAWGRNDFGQSTVPPGLSNVIDIAGGGYHSLALRNDGVIFGWGKSDNGRLVPPPSIGNSNFVQVAAGLDHSLGLKANSTVAAWGLNDFNQTRVPSGLTNVVAIAAGDRHSMALLRNGTLVVWGDNAHGQTNTPAGLTGVVAIAAGADHCLAMQSNGSVVGWGQNNFGQADTSALRGFIMLAAGGTHSLGLKKVLLRLQTPQRQPDGSFRVIVVNEDGSTPPLDSLSKYEVHVTTNWAGFATNWPVLPGGLVFSAGKVQILDTNKTPAMRFYLTVEKP